MNSIAKDYFKLTVDTDFRTRMTSPGSAKFPFYVTAYTHMETESCIVGMLMAWSVITLESVINHLIAERINNKIMATLAIEYPSQVIDKTKLGKNKSELSKKIIILTDGTKNIEQIITMADELAETRNSIIHDKPFDYIEHDEGEVTIDYFCTRSGNPKKYHYHEIGEFFKKCDNIINCLLHDDIKSSHDFSGLKFFPLYDSIEHKIG